MNGWTAESVAKIGISRTKAEAVNLKAKAMRGAFHKRGQMNKLVRELEACRRNRRLSL